jgi:DNA repair exonuclease SbcCD ATPase subunit
VAGGSVGAGPAGAVAVVPAGGSEVKAAAAPVSSVTAPAFPVATQGQRVKDLIAMAKEKKELVERAAEKVADIQNVSIKDLERFLDETEQVLKDLDAAEEEIGNLALAVPDEISTLDAHIRVYREQAKKALKEKEAAEKKARGVAPAFTD